MPLDPNTRIPDLPDIYNGETECFKTWVHDPLPKGFSFPHDILQFCMRWEESLTADINEHVKEYGDDGEHNHDSVRWRESHQRAHDRRQTRDQLRLAIDIMLKHNVGTVDLSDTLWQTLNQEVGTLFWNMRRIQDEQREDGIETETFENDDVKVTVVKANGIGDMLRQIGAALPPAVAMAMLRTMQKSDPERYASVIRQIEDPDSDVPDDVREAYRRLKNDGLI